MSAVEGSTLSVAVCATGSVSVLCVHMCVCKHVCVSGICVKLLYWLNLQTGRQQQYPSVWAETLGPWAGIQQLGRRNPQAQSCWRQW